MNKIHTLNKYGVTYNIHDMEEYKWFFNVFNTWKNEAFDIFEYIKKLERFNYKNIIVLNIGAWIGDTTIWLSKNFKHVIAVEYDKIALKYLKMNIESSNCENVTICEKPVVNNKLNDAYTLTDIHNLYISKYNFFNMFIICDMYGNEENIIEDLFFYSLLHDCNIYISFYTNKWKNNDISRFSKIFSYFHSNIPDAIEYLKQDIKNEKSILFIPNINYKKYNL